MPWLAPCWPRAMPEETSQAPICDCSRCSRSAGSRFVARSEQCQQPQPVQAGGVGEGLGVDGADQFHRMVHRADGGREPQPFRRMHRDRRIEDHRHRAQLPRDIEVLLPAQLIHAAGGMGELGGGERGGHRDLPQPAGADGGADDLPIGTEPQVQGIELPGLGDILRQRHLDHLGQVDRRAAADRDEDIRPGGAGGRGGGQHHRRGVCGAPSSNNPAKPRPAPCAGR